MKKISISLCISLLLLGIFATKLCASNDLSGVCSSLEHKAKRLLESGSPRAAAIGELASKIVTMIEGKGKASLIFICTHNSRRSQIAQVMAIKAAEHMGVDSIQFFSGGTEVTACNPRTVDALRRVGFPIEQLEFQSNPHYSIKIKPREEPLELFSKKYDHSANPKEDFIAVMVCSDADENCPLVRGCTSRVSLPYEDPKSSDNTDSETAVYDMKCLEIGSEQFALLRLVSQKLQAKGIK